jgi:DNA-binding transcriptional LysR family regulator
MQKMDHLSRASSSLSFGRAKINFHSRIHDTENPHVTLKQWKILHAVNDLGGFTEAAEFLHVSQSSISYGIARIQENLDVPLLRFEGRRAKVTEAGKIILDRTRHLLREALEIEHLAKNLDQGQQAELRLVVDHCFPSHFVMDALSKFSRDDSQAKVNLTEIATGDAEKVLSDKTADIAIATNIPHGFLGNPLIELEYVAVAHPNHPLFRFGRSLTNSDLNYQSEVRIGGTRDVMGKGMREPRTFSHWRVGSFETAMRVLLQGFCYAWLPKLQVQKWVERGSLRILPLAEGSVRKLSFYIMNGKPWNKDSSTARLIEVFRTIAYSEWSEGNESLIS